MRIIAIPDYVAVILAELNSAGYEAYAVGGCCRDALLGRTPNDWDVCTSALPEETMEIFTEHIPTGLKHGTVTVKTPGGPIEVTTFRVDGEYHDHRRPDEVRFTTSLREDLARRDFTMNAMAADIYGTITDPFGGKGDIEKGIIRSVGNAWERFNEDALRMFRAVRFSSQLGFELDPQLVEAAKKLSSTAHCIAAERIFAETIKALLSPYPEKLSSAFEWGLYPGVMPCTPDLSMISEFSPDPVVRLIALASVLIKCRAISSVPDFVRSLRASAAQIRVSEIIFNPEPIWYGKTLAQTAAASGREYALCAASAMEVFGLDGSFARMKKLLASDRCLSVKELDVTGRDLMDLGYSGKDVGKCLGSLLEHVLAFPEDNHRETLLKLAEK